ncbi:MAG: hypothetical protein J1F41_10160 [Lachnospiraceae bacterium]|nr:hypothetical protein [Lachnospiraceae bacterium]
MGYIRAGDVLPEDVLELVQQYADGQSLYIPRRSECHKPWGAGTETKKELMNRNSRMYDEYQSGATITQLSERYFLTEKSVQRIIRNHKK